MGRLARARDELLDLIGRWRLALGLVFAAGLLALWLAGPESDWARLDAVLCHVPYIRDLLEGRLLEALRNPASAMPPFYHLLGAGAAELTGLGLYTAGRLVSLVCALCVVLLLVRSSHAPQAQKGGFVAYDLAVLALSWPFLSASLSPVTDTCALLLLVLLLNMLEARRFRAAGLVLMLLILTRQQYVVVPLALLCARLASLRLGGQVGGLKARAARITLGAPVLWVTLVGLACTIGLVILWKGFMPPRFVTQYRADSLTLNPGGLALAIAYLGAGVLIAAATGILRISRRDLFAGLAGALLLLLVLPAWPDEAAGRWGSVYWRLSQFFMVGPYNLLFLSLYWAAVAGAVAWARTFLLQVSEVELFYCALIAGLALIFCLQPYAWQRYIDPMIGLALGRLLAAGARRVQVMDRRSSLSGPSQSLLRRALLNA